MTARIVKLPLVPWDLSCACIFMTGVELNEPMCLPQLQLCKVGWMLGLNSQTSSRIAKTVQEHSLGGYISLVDLQPSDYHSDQKNALGLQ